MCKYFSLFSLPFLLLFLLSNGYSKPLDITALAPYGLLCDLLPGNEVHTTNNRPVFSWIDPMNQTGGDMQTAYQIIVSVNKASNSNNLSVIWDSGRINSQQSSGVQFGGPLLLANKSYCWKVRIWTNNNSPTAYSASQMIKTGNETAGYNTPARQLVKSVQHPLKLINREGIVFADFGKEAFAQFRLQLTKSKSDSVVIHLGERLDSEGKIDRRPGGAIRYSRYVVHLKDGTRWYDLKLIPDARNTGPSAIKMPPAIGEVTPFRYVEIENYDVRLATLQIERLMVHYPFDEQAASFKCSDTVLNQVWELCKYSIKATTFAGIYVDGDRERSPYEADALINQLSHYAVDREYAIARKSHEYLINKARWPTEWIMQSLIIAWNDYLYTGDSRSLKNYYGDLKSKTLLALQDTSGLVSTFNQTDSIRKSVHYNGKELRDIVDWPHGGGTGLGKDAKGESDGFVFKRYNAVTNAYFYNSLVLMTKIATALHQSKDAAMFEQKAANVRKVYRKAFWDNQRKVIRDGVGTEHSALHSNFFALAFGLINKEDTKAVMEFIKSRRMACSVYGSQFLLDAVYDAGGGDYGCSLLTDTSTRSWYNMMRKGSTITMEAWDDIFKPNQDWNHAWGAAPANIISRKLMGIQPVEAGWSRFSIKPQPGSLNNAQITVPTIKGEVKMQFYKSDKAFDMTVTVPANTIAVVYLPVSGGKNYKLSLDGKFVKNHLQDGFVTVNEVKPGYHTFNLTF